jgi:hypothetical protein
MAAHAAAPGNQIGTAQGVIPGCPSGHNLLEASPFLQNNQFLYGSRSVRLNASSTAVLKPSIVTAALSPWMPTLWYSSFQKHIPYSDERLTARKVMREAADMLAHEDLARDRQSDREFKSRVWALLTRMHADQKWYSLRFGSWLITHICNWLYNGEIYVNSEACAALRAQAKNSAFV